MKTSSNLCYFNIHLIYFFSPVFPLFIHPYNSLISNNLLPLCPRSRSGFFFKYCMKCITLKCNSRDYFQQYRAFEAQLEPEPLLFWLVLLQWDQIEYLDKGLAGFFTLVAMMMFVVESRRLKLSMKDSRKMHS